MLNEVDPANVPTQATRLEKWRRICMVVYSVSLLSGLQRHLEVLGWPFLGQFHLLRLPIPLCLYFF